MGKQQLKKEIQLLERDQLEQMILEAYSAKKEIKEYFDFFLNPDVDKLTDRFKLEVDKEFHRGKRGYSKARITNLRRMLKDFEGFHPGFDKQIDLMFYIVNQSLTWEAVFNYTDTLMKGTASIMTRMLDIADANYVADRVLADLTAMLADESVGTRYFRRYLRDSLAAYRPAATK